MNAIGQKDYKKANNLFSLAEKLAKKYQYIYLFRSFTDPNLPYTTNRIHRICKQYGIFSKKLFQLKSDKIINIK